MISILRKLPVPAYIVMMLLLCIPAYVKWTESRLHSRIVHHCYDPKLMLEECFLTYYQREAKAQGVEVALKKLHRHMKNDPTLTTNCHESMHEIGHVAYDEYGSIAKAYAHADYSCWGGYLHGVIEESLRGKNLKDIPGDSLRTLCDGSKAKGKKSFEHFSCVHGIGHALMFISDNDLPQALIRCDDLADTWETGQCVNGAFMQNMFSKYNDHHSQYLPTSDLHFPCSIAREKDKGACYQVQGRLILDALNWDFTKGFAFCGTLATKELRFSCADGLGAAVSNHSAYDTKTIVRLCALAGELEQDCLYGALTDLEGVVGDTNLGAKVCEREPEPVRSACTNTLKRTHEDFPGSINERQSGR